MTLTSYAELALLMVVAGRLTEEEENEEEFDAEEFASDTQTDSMGYGIIAYWPSLTLEK